MPLFDKDKKRRQQDQEREAREQQMRRELEIQQQNLREQQAEFNRYRQEQESREAYRQYEQDRIRREEEVKEQQRLEYEHFLQQQSRLQIAEAEAEKQSQQTAASAENVRKLRELIRTRHHLDTVIWSKKGARSADQDLTLKKMAQSDAILVEIRCMVETWEQDHFKKEEWRVAKKIKESLLRDDKQIWEGNPPWYYR